ncbi:MAG: PTS fructose transporter subunit IIA [Rhodobacteraceae bacterium]|nr:PTS fructose transporter subunit IIA [Paracoccaceae bacterium]
MIGIVIVAHGGLAKEYLAAAEHVLGKLSDVVAIPTVAEEDRSAKQAEICAAAASVDQGDGVVVVVDMFGSSPSNLALKACRGSGRRIMYGANLPMIVKLAKSRRQPLDKAVDLAVAAGKKYMNASHGLQVP